MTTTIKSATKTGYEVIVVDLRNLAHGQDLRLGHNGRLRTPRPIRVRYVGLPEALAGPVSGGPSPEPAATGSPQPSDRCRDHTAPRGFAEARGQVAAGPDPPAHTARGGAAVRPGRLATTAASVRPASRAALIRNRGRRRQRWKRRAGR
jgi:hypothetical protein